MAVNGESHPLKPPEVEGVPGINPVTQGDVGIEDLTEALRPYVRSPRLTLAITQYAANRVSVIGAVAKPGVYPLRRQGDTLTELLSVAGGRTDRAGTRIVLIPPNANGSGQGASSPAAQKSSRDFPPLGYGVELDISDLMGTADRPPLRVPLVAGDTIIVPEAGTREHKLAALHLRLNRGAESPRPARSATSAVAARSTPPTREPSPTSSASRSTPSTSSGSSTA